MFKNAIFIKGKSGKYFPSKAEDGIKWATPEVFIFSKDSWCVKVNIDEEGTIEYMEYGKMGVLLSEIGGEREFRRPNFLSLSIVNNTQQLTIEMSPFSDIQWKLLPTTPRLTYYGPLSHDTQRHMRT